MFFPLGGVLLKLGLGVGEVVDLAGGFFEAGGSGGGRGGWFLFESGELVGEGLPGFFEGGEGFFLGALDPVGLGLGHGVAGIVHFFEGALEGVGGGGGRGGGVLPDHVGFVEEVGLTLAGLPELRIGVAAVADIVAQLALVADGIVEVGDGLAEDGVGIGRSGEDAGQFAELVADDFLAAGGVVELAGFEGGDGGGEGFGEVLDAGGGEGFGEALLELGRGGLLGKGFEAGEGDVGFGGEAFLFGGLCGVSGLVGLVESGEGASLHDFGEGDGLGEVAGLAVGEDEEAQGDVLEFLAAAVLGDKLAHLDEDVFLAGVRGQDVALGGGGLWGLAGGLEEVHDALHLVIAELVKDAADGAEGLDVVAVEAVAFEVFDEGAELEADALDLGTELLLPAFGVEEVVSGGSVGDGGGEKTGHGQVCEGFHRRPNTIQGWRLNCHYV